MVRHETEKLVGYLEGGLAETTRERVKRHLASCARCRAALAELRAARVALGAVGAETPAPIPDADLWARVHAEITPTPPVARARRPRWALAGGAMGFATVAAALTLWFARPAPKPMITAELPPAAPAPAVVHPRPAKEPVRADRQPARPAVPEAYAPPKPTPARQEPRRLARLEPPPETPYAPVPPPAPAVEVAPTPAPAPASPTDVPAPAALTAETRAMKAAPQAEAHEGAAPAAPAPAPMVGGFGGPKPTARADAPGEPMALRRAPGLDRVAAEGAPAKTSRQSKATLEGQRAFQRANAALARGKADEAASAYRDALAQGVTVTEARVAHLRLGDAAVRAGDDATALAEFTAAVEIAKDAEALNRLGAVYERLGDIPKAINAYEQSLILQPGNVTARAALSRLKP